MSRVWSPHRLAGAAVLGSWAALFWFVILTGRTPLYLSDRTAWVAPLGAGLLTLASLGRLLSARTRGREPVSSRTAWQMAFVLLPVVALLVLPPATLGSYAASRRSLATAGFAGATSGSASGEVALEDVAAAMWSDEALGSLSERAGSEVTFVGIVARGEGTPEDEFLLTRFLVSCCVADALSVQVRVVGAPPGLAEDRWVEVTGTIFPLGREVIVQASEVRPVPRPSDPYLQV